MINRRTAPLPRSLLCLILVAASFAAACKTPIGVERIDARTVQRQLTRNVLNSKQLSDPTLNVLRLANLEADADKRPEEVIELVHGLLLDDAQHGEAVSRRALIALAEMTFAHAEETHDRHYFFAAALYAWLFLFPDDPALAPDPFDPRLRLAADIYNRSVTLAFLDRETDTVRFQAETVPLPVGALEITLDESSLVWGDRKLVDFVPVSELAVRGLRNRYRWRGLGAPFAAVLEPVAPDDRRDAYLSPKLRLPVAALLRFERDQRALRTGVGRARLELHAAPDGQEIEIEGRRVPLEMEPTSSIASMLKDHDPWTTDMKRFFAGDLAQERDGLVSLEPYRPGRIPVVLVHGTFSSAPTWAEVVNDLTNDPEIRRRFQFWVFDYNTGNPVAYSAWLLRRAIDDLVGSLDPEGKDPALERTIVVGHSQGGLLTKLMAVDPDLEFWRLLSDKAPDEVELDPESREILEGSLLVDPLPMVERVVFIATPHRGSYMANRSIAKWIGRLARSPIAVVDAIVDLATDDAESQSRRELARTSGSIDNMSPGNAFLAALVDQPVVPEVTSHSIIAVRGKPDLDDEQARRKASDGVVKYESAHLDGVKSELIVPSSHTCLGHPWTIAELRRILLSHVGLRGRGPAELNLP